MVTNGPVATAGSILNLFNTIGTIVPIIAALIITVVSAIAMVKEMLISV